MKQLHWSRPHQVQINLCPRSEFTSTLVCFGFLSLQGWLEVRSIRFLAPQTNVYSLRKKIINISENLNQVYFILGVWGSPSQINPNTGQCSQYVSWLYAVMWNSQHFGEICLRWLPPCLSGWGMNFPDTIPKQTLSTELHSQPGLQCWDHNPTECVFLKSYHEASCMGLGWLTLLSVYSWFLRTC